MRRLIPIGFLACLALAGCAQRVLVQPVINPEKVRRLAVLPLESDSIFSTVGNQLADEIVVQLLRQVPTLEVIERSRIDAVLQEQSMSRQGYLQPDSAVAVGRLLGVQAILTGSVSLAIGAISPTALSAQRVANGTATVRVIDTETGRIIWAGREEAQYSSFVNFDYQNNPVSVKTDQEMIQEVIKDLAQAVAQKFYPHYELQY